MTFLLPYIMALLLTLIIEGSLCWLFLKSTAWLTFTCLVNLFTNPLVNFVYTVLYLRLSSHNLSGVAPWILLLLEVAVWLSEAWLFYKFGCRHADTQIKPQKSISSIYKALLFSFVLNAATYLTGLLLQI